RVRRKLKGKAITSFADIQAGDLVVHEIHGIGRFEAIESVEIDNVRKDYIKILYRDNGVLFVPTHQLDSVQKYIGNDGESPKLNKLGSAEWNRTTAKVKESLRTYAKELVELYARRARLKGHAFSKDTVWQQEFEDSFPFDETDDQLRCSEEIKRDMEAPKPMERLLCGDVGYGKTEVALRAAFKAVCDGKQVAFMVPTTVLAQQHYKNFMERLKNFPITIDYLCRFRTQTQRKKVLERLAEGKIDILVGTHSLIKDKVTFKNLGLAIIDEEQRFGVLHKDRFKQQHPEVDMLSLSATPIPRTLHMSLSGIRDISVLEDPPQDRLPVQTYVAEWDPALIRNGIYREMARKGQVFYLYNRVQTMGEKLLALRNLVPEARIAMAHGQMSERELEDIMQAFYQGEYDVLLCTTIIESGLDMPNVNTIIVEDSDRMGLAQLYQIRGRVGRASKLAYAYITYKKDKNLSEIAEKRLRTIREFTEFGSGFKIALRDLEIRGAGSVLGERQHGQLAVVGYETYCRLLSEVVLEEQGGKMAPQKPPISIEFKVNAYISSDYIEDEEARFDLYQKIARVETEEDAMEVTDELIDRYGDVPDTVQNLLKISRIRFLSERCGFSAVIQKPQCFSFLLGPGAVFMRKLDGERELAYQHFTKKYGRKMSLNAMSSPASLALFIDLNQSQSDILDEILEFLQDLCGVMG
ncbi:MAG: transcription-repair coupling factor, partial [Clostridia bacterium]|nr:transcription-repair coupling factor [Clostridia bacterium]